MEVPEIICGKGVVQSPQLRHGPRVVGSSQAVPAAPSWLL